MENKQQDAKNPGGDPPSPSPIYLALQTGIIPLHDRSTLFPQEERANEGDWRSQEG